MNRRILFGGASILAAFAMMGGATFAFFSSNATSTGNIFASGTVHLQLDDNNQTAADTIDASFGGTNLGVGSTAVGFVSLHNAGTITIAKVKLSATETVTSSPNLADKLNITSAKIGSELTCTTSPVDITSSLPATLAGLNGVPVSLPSSNLAASGADKFLCMVFTVDSGTDNTYQGKSITETFNFEGDQDLSQ